MENNLDKYFKDNLHGRKFEMKEEFWLGAEKLLEAQERRRKRRGIFWWFGGGLAVLSLVALGWWFLGENGIANQAVVPSKIAEQTQTPNSEASPVFDEKNGEKSSAQSNKTEEIEGAATLFLEG